MQKGREDYHSLHGVFPTPIPCTRGHTMLPASHLFQPPGLLVHGWKELPGSKTSGHFHVATTWQGLGSKELWVPP